MAAKISGIALRIQANTGTFGAFSGTDLDCEVESTGTFNRSEIDVSGKCVTNGWSELLGFGIGTWDITGSGKYAAGDAGVDRIRTDIITNNTMAQIKWLTFNSEVLTGDGQFTTFSMTSAYDGVVEFDFSFKGSGAPTWA